MSYTLYHFPSSICSIMVRYTLAVRGPPRDEESAMAVAEKIINITRDEQLTEEFLCDINPKGQVEHQRATIYGMSFVLLMVIVFPGPCSRFDIARRDHP